LAVAIRLTRVGATKRPAYRVIAIDKRRSRDGRALEILGFYDPLTEPATVQLETDKIKAWIGKGARPSDMVVRLMRQAEAAASGGGDPVKPRRATRSATKPSKKARAKAESASTAAEEPATAAVTTEEDAPAAEAAAPAEAAEAAAVEDTPAEAEAPVEPEAPDRAEAPADDTDASAETAEGATEAADAPAAAEGSGTDEA
jgi:small subunit ribosomal protein S16